MIKIILIILTTILSVIAAIKEWLLESNDPYRKFLEPNRGRNKNNNWYTVYYLIKKYWIFTSILILLVVLTCLSVSEELSNIKKNEQDKLRVDTVINQTEQTVVRLEKAQKDIDEIVLKTRKQVLKLDSTAININDLQEKNNRLFENQNLAAKRFNKFLNPLFPIRVSTVLAYDLTNTNYKGLQSYLLRYKSFIENFYGKCNQECFSADSSWAYLNSGPLNRLSFYKNFEKDFPRNWLLSNRDNIIIGFARITNLYSQQGKFKSANMYRLIYKNNFQIVWDIESNTLYVSAVYYVDGLNITNLKSLKTMRLSMLDLPNYSIFIPLTDEFIVAKLTMEFLSTQGLALKFYSKDFINKGMKFKGKEYEFTISKRIGNNFINAFELLKQ